MRVRATFMGRASACWAWDLASVVRKSHEHDGNANGEKNSLFRRWRWRSIQARFFSHLGPGDAQLFAVRALGPFNGPGIFNVFDRLTHPAETC